MSRGDHREPIFRDGQDFAGADSSVANGGRIILIFVGQQKGIVRRFNHRGTEAQS